MGKLSTVLKSASTDFVEDDAMVSGAALAYYTIFSLPPLLVVVFFVAGHLGVSHDKIDEVVRRQLGMPLPAATQGKPASSSESGERGGPEQGGEALQQVAERRSSSAAPLKDALGPGSKVIGFLILVFSATGVFAQLQQALNRAWEVEPDPGQGGVKGFLVKRGLSLGMVVVIAFLLLVSLVLSTLVDELIYSVLGQAPSTTAQVVGTAVNNLLALTMATLLFAAMFKILPDADMYRKDMWVGAFFTALLFVVGKALIGWYLQNSQIGLEWGSAAASMIAMLVWVYYSSMIVLFGAELTQAWAETYGGGIAPESGAVRVVQRKEHQREGETPAVSK